MENQMLVHQDQMDFFKVEEEYFMILDLELDVQSCMLLIHYFLLIIVVFIIKELQQLYIHLILVLELNY